jgi:hypothetical protein
VKKKKMLGLWSIESTPENAAIKNLCARRVHGKDRRYKQVLMKKQRVGSSYQSSALEVESWCAGSGEEDCRTNSGSGLESVLYERRRPRSWALGSSYFVGEFRCVVVSKITGVTD